MGENVTFTEAPVSFNVKASYEGYDVMLTIRDSDTGRLMDRAIRALEWMQEHGFEPTSRGRNGNESHQAEQAPLCPTHNQPMKRSKHGGWYCPVKVADDDGTGKPVYCKQRIK